MSSREKRKRKQSDEGVTILVLKSDDSYERRYFENEKEYKRWASRENAPRVELPKKILSDIVRGKEQGDDWASAMKAELVNRREK